VSEGGREMGTEGCQDLTYEVRRGEVRCSRRVAVGR
jgi:hypothetical protein